MGKQSYFGLAGLVQKSGGLPGTGRPGPSLMLALQQALSRWQGTLYKMHSVELLFFIKTRFF